MSKLFGMSDLFRFYNFLALRAQAFMINTTSWIASLPLVMTGLETTDLASLRGRLARGNPELSISNIVSGVMAQTTGGWENV